jgi:cation diffusion facilitator CzcD-associated flavoprotein CzcO
MSARVAIVGSGLGGFVAYATLRHSGLEPGEIAVFGNGADPAGAWKPRAAAIRQRLMRSESDGHCAPASFPGLAAREAVRRRDLAPLVLSVCDRYRPTVEEFLRHVTELRERSRWDESIVLDPIDRIAAVEGGFEVGGHGVFRHVLVATGHPCLAVPHELAGDPRVVHAYEPHEYASRVTIVGAGMAAATEWLNALAVGSEVVSVRRREPARRPLNVARPFFTKRGLAGFYAAPRERRAELLQGFGEPSYPPGRSWDAPLEAAKREGRFRVETAVNGAEQVICATGFRAGFRHDPLLARLVDEDELETEGRWIVLANDSTVPSVTDSTRTLALAGVPGQWAFPAADTLVGMKVAARRFSSRVVSCPTR